EQRIDGIVGRAATIELSNEAGNVVVGERDRKVSAERFREVGDAVVGVGGNVQHGGNTSSDLRDPDDVVGGDIGRNDAQLIGRVDCNPVADHEGEHANGHVV